MLVLPAFLFPALGYGLVAARILIPGFNLTSEREREAPVSLFTGVAPPAGVFLAVAFGLGTGALMLLMFVTCAAGVTCAASAGGILAVGAVFFLLNIREFGGAVKDITGVIPEEIDKSAAGRAIALACVLPALIPLLVALAPPVDVDAVNYHLTLPKIYLREGGFVSTPAILYSHFPQGTGLLYAYALALGSAPGAQLIHYAFGLFAALGIASLTRRLSGSGVAGAAAGGLFLVTPLVQWEMSSAYTDLAAGLYLFGAFSLLALPGEKRKGVVAAAGLLAGFAVATKLTAGPYAAVLALLCGWLRGGPAGGRIKAAALFSAACAIPVAPWLIRTYIETGNPVFPFFYSVLGGRNWNPEIDRHFLQWHLGDFGTGKSLKSLLMLPYSLAANPGLKFGWMPPDDVGVGFFHLVFLPAALIPVRTLERRRVVAFFVPACLAVWFLGSQQHRFLLNFWPALCVLYGAGLYEQGRKNRIAGAVLVAVAVVLAVAGQAQNWRRTQPALAAVFGEESRRIEYIRTNYPPYDAFLKLDGIAAGRPGAKAGLLFESRAFYSDTPFVWLMYSQQAVVDYTEIKTAERLGSRLGELGIRYILVDARQFAADYRQTKADVANGEEIPQHILNFYNAYYELLTGGEARPVYGGPVYAIYELGER